ncbi:F0F1 ATP synthase subunit B [Kitasatospora sp. MAP5-34]|uniref:F0F1 ATP synthase subunit B n=1 Tax=Kitasatospora sp. MAP5-34 TaxID=3035102 RepID=UPI002473B509|nr:F0F1 ATP synthase subunit B [Kitasatospora sp. MAP5-34]MDH6575644.1 F-type H+-transporting ATPase subunit b [Kitasatospora sp. MAP5-34]
MGPLKPDIGELILGLVCFFLIFGILGKVLLPRIERNFAARADVIEGGLERAETVGAEAERVYAEYQAELSTARHDAAAIRQQAAEQGAELLAEVRAEGQRQRDSLVAAAQVQLAADLVIAEASLREDVVTLATELASRVVGEPLGGLPGHQDIVDRFFAELETTDASTGTSTGTGTGTGPHA